MTLFSFDMEEAQDEFLTPDQEKALNHVCRLVRCVIKNGSVNPPAPEANLLASASELLSILDKPREVLSDSMLLLGTAPFVAYVRRKYPGDDITDATTRRIMEHLLTDLWLDP